MPVPLPDQPKLTRPDAAEAQHLLCGVVSAVAPPTGLTPLQRILVESLFVALTDHEVRCDAARPIDADDFAAGLADRNAAFRTRIVQVMLLPALVLRPLPPEVADRVAEFARALSVDDGMLEVARRFADGQLGLAAVDFQRNGYTSDWTPAKATALHTSTELADAWSTASADEALAARWRALEDLPAGTLGRMVSEFYRARGFAYPGVPGSAPPLLAQHDWVHVLADYGSTVEAELEVFAFISRATDDPRGFSLLAMVVSLFETGYLETGAGLFEAFPGQLSHDGVAVRVADAMRRGAYVATPTSPDVDFLAVDWFELAALPIDEARALCSIVPKSAMAIAAGSASPFGVGGISEFQDRHGRAEAAAAGVPYEAFGATVARG